jgi:hypothetical protein
MKRVIAVAVAGLLMIALGALPVMAYGPGGGPGSGECDGSGSAAGYGRGAGPGDCTGSGPGAGNGYGNGPGNGSQAGDPSYILNGEPFVFSGAVSAVGYLNGGGLTLATSNGTVAVYGIGPLWYWEREGFDWPQVGDSMGVAGFTVELDGVSTNILMSATTVNGKALQLRDPDTGWPLWVNK